MRSFALCLFLFSLGATAAAQGPAPRAPDDIVVTGPRTEEAIRNFVDDLGVPMGGDNQQARWDQRICPGVAGLRTRYAQLLIDRIAQRAFDVGLDVDEPGCSPTVLIIVSSDPDTAAADLLNNHREALGYFESHGQTTLSREALHAFVDSDAPVRWWHVGRSHMQSGEPVRSSRNAPSVGGGGMSSPTAGGAPVVFRFGGASHISRAYRQDMAAAFIIVDARRMSDIDLDFTALADYLSMVTLANVSPETDAAELPSILNLFHRADAPRELTEWDVSYLRGLYAADREDSGIRQQGQIARNMQGELTGQ